MAELDRNMSEGERRDIVRALATRTDRGYEIKETTVQPQYDYAAAAEAAVAADPVSVSAQTAADLAARTNAPSEAGSLYAEAQRAIFEAGRGREGEYSDVWFDDHKGVIDASMFALDEYRAAVEADRAAAASRKASGTGGGTPRIPPPPTQLTDVENPLEPWLNMLSIDQRDRLTSVVQNHTDLANTFYAQSGAFFQQRLDEGYTWEQARREAYTYLTSAAGLTPNEAMDMLSVYTAVWESAFKGETVTYDPAAGMGPGITGPYLPTPGVGTAPVERSSNLVIR